MFAFSVTVHPAIGDVKRDAQFELRAGKSAEEPGACYGILPAEGKEIWRRSRA
jgi:hypothetical protein